MSETSNKTAAQMVAEAKGAIENLTPQQVAEELEKPGVLLVDIRDSDERAQNGVISGALHVSRGMLEFRADSTSPYHNPALTPDKRVILHCASGGRSALAVNTLKEMGYTDVAHMDGGFNTWKEQGKAVAEGSSE